MFTYLILSKPDSTNLLTTGNLDRGFEASDILLYETMWIQIGTKFVLTNKGQRLISLKRVIYLIEANKYSVPSIQF